MYRRRRHSRALLIARNFPCAPSFWLSCGDGLSFFLPSLPVSRCQTIKSGGSCGRAPPLPIPNREVKPACADGTAMQCGRVGRRLLSEPSPGHFTVAGALCVFGGRRGGGGEEGEEREKKDGEGGGGGRPLAGGDGGRRGQPHCGCLHRTAWGWRVLRLLVVGGWEMEIMGALGGI